MVKIIFVQYEAESKSHLKYRYHAQLDDNKLFVFKSAVYPTEALAETKVQEMLDQRAIENGTATA